MGPAFAATVLDVVTMVRVEGLLVVVEAGLLEGLDTELDFEDDVETCTELDFEDEAEVEVLIELVFEDAGEACMELDFEDDVELFTELEVEETGHVPDADPTNMTSV